MAEKNPNSGNPYLFLVRQAWHYGAGKRRDMVIFYGLIICANFAILAQPWIFGKTLNILQAGGPDLFQRIWPWFLLYGAMMLIFWCFHGPARIIERRFGFHVKQSFFMRQYRAVTELPLSWHSNNHTGDTINRIYKAGSGLYTFAENQFMYLETGIRFIGALIMLSVVSPMVGIMAVVGAVVIMFMIRGFDRRLITTIREQNRLDHFFSAGLHDFISNINTLITLRLAPLTQHELTRRMLAIFAPLSESIKLVEVKWFCFMMLSVVLESSIMLTLIYYQIVVRHNVQMGTLVTVFQYFRQINMVFFSFSSFYQVLMRTRIDMQSVAPITEAAESIERNHAPPMPQDWQTIELRELHFGYDEDKSRTLCDLNLTLRRGARIALVGESGAGKSSLLSVLRGIYPADANVEIDGAMGKIAMLADVATLIPQDAEIFESTIAENITMGVHAEDARMQHAAAVAEFAPVAAMLPNGYDTDIREKGVNLSGGQKQRLALSRGLFSAEDSSILLLDEPTSSVDAATELKIFQNLFAAYPQTAIVASLHRLHLLPRFDHIYVMEKGKIIEQGKFSDLLAQGGALKKLWDKYEQT